MAEILVKALDATHPDPETDRRACYKRGDPVVVRPDGHPWGRAERPPTFWLVKVPGVPVEALRSFVEPEPSPIVGPHGEALVVRRRRWRLDVSRVPALADAGEATLSVAQLRAALRETRTGERAG